jgi:CRISPR-associated protein Cmr1
VRLRLDKWAAGTLRSWSGLEQSPVEHPEVERAGRRVGPHVYLGFGPLTVEGRETVLTKGRAAIQAAEHAALSLAVPEAELARIRLALACIDRYGALGGRSRNGWGSVTLRPEGETPLLKAAEVATPTLPWRDALRSEWPQALGCDAQGPLVWQTKQSSADWKALMRQLAEIKIALRTRFAFNTGRDAARPEARHWLSYPVTNHSVRDWGANARLPNTLRFKVRADADGKLRGVIFHMPCLPPPSFAPDRGAIETVWQTVHQHLDSDTRLQRIPG